MRELTSQEKRNIEKYFYSNIRNIPKEWKDPEFMYYVERMRDWASETMASWEREDY
jgi:type 1 glutamine amidotransferase